MDLNAFISPFVELSWEFILVPSSIPGKIFFAGSKKIHNFLMDLKIPKSSRTLVPIFFDRNKIVLVGGFRKKNFAYKNI